MQQVTSRRKHLILSIADGDMRAFPLLHQIDTMFKRREEVYHWLIGQEITGKKFVEYYQENANSMARMYSRIISDVDRYKKQGLHISDLI